MKIAVVTKYFPTSAHPWAGHSAYQTLRLLAQRHDVRVFYGVSRYPNIPGLKRRAEDEVDLHWQPGDVPVEYIPYPALPMITRAFNGWTISRTLFDPVRSFAPDVLLNYVIYPDGYAATRIARRLGVPVVLTAIGSDLNRIPDRLCLRHTQFALRHADVTTTVSHDLARTAQRLGSPPDRTITILNGCDTTVFQPRDRSAARAALHLSQNEQVIVYVGRLDLRKGLAELIEAAASIHRTHPQLAVYLVGDGPDKPHLEALVEQNRLSETVRFIPPCDTDQVAAWMAAADLVTLPSYKEGCPNVVLEALAAGRPVVATDVGGIPELMDSTAGRLVPPMNVTALAQALSDVLATPWSAEEIANRHNRNWADVAADLENVLMTALVQTRS